MSAPATRGEVARRALLAKLHLGRKALGLDEDTYRALLMRETGADSAKSLSLHQLELVLGAMRSAGFRDVPRERQKRPQDRMVWALWMELSRAGGVEAKDKRAALRSFVERMTGVADLAWVTSEQANVVVEAIKAMLQRQKKAAT